MNTIIFLLIFIAPMLTMRLLSEEKQTGTIELLLTSPVRDWQLVVGKFFAALGVWLAILFLTLAYVIVLKLFGNPDMIPIATGYLALILIGSATISIGVLTSAISPNQIIAVFVSFVIMLVLWIAGFLAPLLGGAGNPVASVITYMSLPDHTNDLVKGVVDSKDVIYYLSVTVGCLFLSTRAIEARRWG